MKSTIRSRSSGTSQRALLGGVQNANGWVNATKTCTTHATRTRAKGESEEKFGDELLDFMYAGKKLRKWYGETDMVLPRDGGPVPEDEGSDEDDQPLEGIPRTAVVVLFPEEDRFPMTEQTLLELIVLRAEVTVVTNDVARAKEGYGQYVEAIKLDSSKATRRALAGAKSVVVCGQVNKQVGEVLRMARTSSSAPRVVLLVEGQGANTQGGMFGGLFESAERKELKNAGRRQALAASGVEVVEVGLREQRDRTAREMAEVAMMTVSA